MAVAQASCTHHKLDVDVPLSLVALPSVKEIDESLRLDPSNVELTELKTELETLVDLLRKSLGPAASTSKAPAASTSRSADAPAGNSGSSAAKTFAAGADVMARWAKDKQFYPARITSVSGAAHDPVYTVIFDIDKTTEVVRSGDVKARKENSYAQGKKRGYGETQEAGGSSGSTPSGSGERDGKKGGSKTEKKAVKEDERKARVAAQNKAQSTWQSFAKKGAKKGISIPGEPRQ